jgi:hypothetical protein
MPPDPPRPLLIGWKEYIDFPDWQFRRVKAKIDTGARSPALGVVRCDLLPTDAGLEAELHLALDRRHPERLRVVRVPVLRMVQVRNSGGVAEERPLIETTIRLGPVEKRITLTVTTRPQMLFPILIGRKALEGDFIVDVSRKYLLKSHPPRSRS